MDPATQLARQGFVVVDVRDPAAPTEIFFQESLSQTFPPRGVHNTFISVTIGNKACARHGKGHRTRVIVHLATETNDYPIYDVTDTISSAGTTPPTLCSNLSAGVLNTNSTGVLPGTGPDDIDPEDAAVGIHDVVVREDPGGSATNSIVPA